MPGHSVAKPSSAARAQICKPNRLPAELYPFVESAAVQFQIRLAHDAQVPRLVRDTLQKIAEQAGALYVTMGTLSEEARNALLDGLPPLRATEMVQTLEHLSSAFMGAARNAALDVELGSKRPSAEMILVGQLQNVLETNGLPVGAEPNGLLVHVTYHLLKVYGRSTADVPRLVARVVAKKAKA